MLSWLIDLAEAVLEWFSAGAAFLWGFLVALLGDLLGQVFAFVVSLLFGGAATFVNDQTAWLMSNAVLYYEGICWFIPMNEILAVVLTVVGICAAIRLGRWIFALIPSLGG